MANAPTLADFALVAKAATSTFVPDPTIITALVAAMSELVVGDDHDVLVPLTTFDPSLVNNRASKYRLEVRSLVQRDGLVPGVDTISVADAIKAGRISDEYLAAAGFPAKGDRAKTRVAFLSWKADKASK